MIHLATTVCRYTLSKSLVTPYDLVLNRLMITVEIEIPKEFNFTLEEEEEEEDLLNKEDSWNDLGLDDFHDDSTNPQAVAPATTTPNK